MSTLQDFGWDHGVLNFDEIVYLSTHDYNQERYQIQCLINTNKFIVYATFARMMRVLDIRYILWIKYLKISQYTVSETQYNIPKELLEADNVIVIK